MEKLLRFVAIRAPSLVEPTDDKRTVPLSTNSDFRPCSSDRPSCMDCLIVQNGPSIRLISPLINWTLIQTHRKWPTP